MFREIFKNNNPSKKVIAFAIISLGIVLALFTSKYLKDHPDVFPYFRSVASDKNKQLPLENLAYDTNSEFGSGIESVDTDEDSLKDWEELLWGTDVNKKDSDSDGTADGEEVREGRNPTKQGPDDYLSKNEAGVSASASLSTGGEDKPLNSTDIFAQTLFSKYLSLKSAGGGTVSEEDKAVLVGDLAADAEDSLLFSQYRRDGMQVFSGEDKSALRFYASSFATLQLNFLRTVANNEEAIKKDPSVVSKLYASLAANLYILKIPQAISTEHLVVVNDLSIASAAFDAFAKFKDDPLRTTAALDTYNRAREMQISALSIIAEYLRKNDIIFTTGEAGDFWNKF